MGIRRIMKREESEDKMATEKYGYNDENRWVVTNPDEVKISAEKRCLAVRNGRRGYGHSQCSSKATQKNKGMLCKKCMDDAQDSVHHVVNNLADAILAVDPHANPEDVNAYIRTEVGKENHKRFKEWDGMSLNVSFSWNMNSDIGFQCIRDGLISANTSPTFIQHAVEHKQSRNTTATANFFEVDAPLNLKSNGECGDRYGNTQNPTVTKGQIERNMRFIDSAEPCVLAAGWHGNGQAIQLYINHTHAQAVQVINGEVEWFVKADGEWQSFPSAEDIASHNQRYNNNQQQYHADAIIRIAENTVKMLWDYAEGNTQLYERLERQLDACENIIEWESYRQTRNQEMLASWHESCTEASLPNIFGEDAE